MSFLWHVVAAYCQTVIPFLQHKQNLWFQSFTISIITTINRNSGQKIPDPSEETEMRAGGHSSGNYRNPCLTMHQPWASLLVYGIKRIEGRSWSAPIRGLYLVISDFNSKFRYPFGELISCSWFAVEVLGLRIREWNFIVLELLVLWYCYLGTEQV